MRNVLFVTLAAVCATSAAVPIKAANQLVEISQPQKSGKQGKSTATRYAIVQVGDSYQVTPTSKVKELKKRLDLTHKRQLKEWQRAKKAAAKSKEKFRRPKPKKQRVKILGSSFKSEAAANEKIARLQEKASKKPVGKRKGG